mgnify:CR=1 FL=1
MADLEILEDFYQQGDAKGKTATDPHLSVCPV